MILYDAVGRGQSKPHFNSGIRRAEAEIKYVLHLLRWHARTRIRYPDVHFIVRLKDLDSDLPPAFDRPDGIHQKIHEDLVELTRSAIDGLQFSVVLDYGYLFPYLGLQEGQRALDAFSQVGHLKFCFVHTREIAQAVDDLAHPCHAAAYDLVGIGHNFEYALDRSLLFGVLGGTALQRLLQFLHRSFQGIVHAADRTDGCIDLVGHTGHQPTEGSHLLLHEEVVLGRSEFL